jgi:uncharacterized protein (TIGR02996 family)
MDAEAPFILAVQAAPGDSAPLLIYADWLEERGDRRAEFLRLRVAIGQLSPNEKQFRPLWRKLRRVRSNINPAWLAALDHTSVENCPVQFAYAYPKRWEAFRPTGDATVRFCDACHRQVYYCSTLEQARDHAKAGDCVAVDSMTNRRPGELSLDSGRRERRHVGIVARPERERSHEEEPDALRGRPRDGRRGNNRRHAE